jgi:hypothetical protein
MQYGFQRAREPEEAEAGEKIADEKEENREEGQEMAVCTVEGAGVLRSETVAVKTEDGEDGMANGVNDLRQSRLEGRLKDSLVVFTKEEASANIREREGQCCLGGWVSGEVTGAGHGRESKCKGSMDGGEEEVGSGVQRRDFRKREMEEEGSRKRGDGEEAEIRIEMSYLKNTSRLIQTAHLLFRSRKATGFQAIRDTESVNLPRSQLLGSLQKPRRLQLQLASKIVSLLEERHSKQRVGSTTLKSKDTLFGTPKAWQRKKARIGFQLSLVEQTNHSLTQDEAVKGSNLYPQNLDQEPWTRVNLESLKRLKQPSNHSLLKQISSPAERFRAVRNLLSETDFIGDTDHRGKARTSRLVVLTDHTLEVDREHCASALSIGKRTAHHFRKLSQSLKESLKQRWDSPITPLIGIESRQAKARVIKPPPSVRAKEPFKPDPVVLVRHASMRLPSPFSSQPQRRVAENSKRKPGRSSKSLNPHVPGH